MFKFLLSNLICIHFYVLYMKSEHSQSCSLLNQYSTMVSFFQFCVQYNVVKHASHFNYVEI